MESEVKLLLVACCFEIPLWQVFCEVMHIHTQHCLEQQHNSASQHQKICVVCVCYLREQRATYKRQLTRGKLEK